MFVSSFPPLTSPSVSQSLLLVSFYFKLNPFLENSQDTRQSISKISQFNKEVTRSSAQKRLYLLSVCVWVHTRCTHVYVYRYLHGDAMVPVEARRGSETLWNWSHRWLWVTWCECRDTNSGPMEREQTLLAAELSPQPHEINVHLQTWILVGLSLFIS